MENGIPARLSRAELRKFGLEVGAALLVLAGIALWRHHTTSPRVLSALGGLLVLGGLIAPMALGPVHTAWMGLAKVLSKITTPIFLGIVYFLLLTPVGVIKRMLGKDSLARHPVEGSYFVKRRQRVSGSMEHQF